VPLSRNLLSAFLVVVACTGWQVEARAQTETAPATAVQSTDNADSLISRALQLYSTGQYASALQAGEQAAKLLGAQGATSAQLATALMVQALCHKRLVHVTEAERLYRQAIDIYEKVQGPDGRDLAIAIDNLASLYMEHGRLAEAEQLRLRALDIFKTTLGSASPHVVTALQNLAVLYQYQERFDEAQQAFEQALNSAEAAFGPESRQVGIIADNLAGFNRVRQQFGKAESLYVRAITVFEKALGQDHPDTALALQNYAILLGETGRPDKAEANIRQALSINERLYGASHVTVAAALNTLVLQYIEQRRWDEALAASRRSTAISVELSRRGNTSVPSESGQGASAMRRFVQVAYNVDAADPTLMNESYVTAQRALETGAALALSQLAARYAIGDDALAVLLRERQDLAAELESRDKLLVAAVARAPSQRDRGAEEGVRSRIAAISVRVEAIDKALAKAFPQYTALARPNPLSIMETQALLRPDEALLQYLDVQTSGAVPEATFAWLITQGEAQFVRFPFGTATLARSVAALRCGLDATQWLDGGAKTCSNLLGVAVPPASAPLPFSLAVAHELYQALLAPFEAKIAGKHLLIIPSGPLTSLPPSVLVTEKPQIVMPSSAESYRSAAWLGIRQPITVLPSVASLTALRMFAPQSHAAKPFFGVGNPLLEGDGSSSEQERAERARAQQRCTDTLQVASAGGTMARGLRRAGSLFRGGQIADVRSIRGLQPLPETRDELCTVARALGVKNLNSDLLLGARATETAVKALSGDGRLAHYQVLHFATHGVLAQEVEADLGGNAEPGLILTPPDKGDSRDDGLLTASEISQLKLNAEWIVLSACNTAGAAGGSGEALSGLARAFFYAGSRAILVSHWAVDSQAAVKLTTGAFAALAADPGIGRADALRHAMTALVKYGEAHEAHPAAWAPFVLVGEGRASAHVGSTLGSATPPKSSHPGKRAPGRPVVPAPDWRSQVLGQ
jgi:CHAT domain-containing protein/tetratricopeptide (TPR) repeat protein